MYTFAVLPVLWATFCQILLLIVAALGIGGFIFSHYEIARLGRLPKSFQLPQSFLLALLTLIVWLGAALNSPSAPQAGFICVGMTCGFVGDLFMANVFKQKHSVEFGMAAFAVGHVCYMLAFREIAVRLALHNLELYALALAITWMTAFVLWWFLVRNPGGSSLQFVALGYSLFLASMSGYALGLAFQTPHFLFLAIGTLLFLFSDSLIAVRLFTKRSFQYMGDVIWITYILAQVLIITVVPLVLDTTR